MRKKGVTASVRELEELLHKHLTADSRINYAIKIIGHPGVGKSAIVKEVAKKINYYFIDTRLAFKENIDLGGYPVPDHAEKRMVYYRPKFIPPETIPEGYDGMVWFLDEANRAHPTVIQTLFQIITEHTCGDHALHPRTAILLAGNLGEGDATTITEFDDAALDGRLAIFHLRPVAQEWISWAHANGIHPSVIRYISLYPEKLWDEEAINPNPRGWHQVSMAIDVSYGFHTPDELTRHLGDNPGSTLAKLIVSLVGEIAGADFITQQTAPRLISTEDILTGNRHKLQDLKAGTIPAEDVLWAMAGALGVLRDTSARARGELSHNELATLAQVLRFIGNSRADSRMSFFYLLLKECGIFTQVPTALRLLDKKEGDELMEKFSGLL